jgi:hypothetical protein
MTNTQHPRRQFCKALDIFLQTKIDDGHQIILGGDLNEDLSLNMQGFTRIVSKHNLGDIHHVNLGAKKMKQLLMHVDRLASTLSL